MVASAVYGQYQPVLHGSVLKCGVVEAVAQVLAVVSKVGQVVQDHIVQKQFVQPH
jgi:hypothetical protein